MAGLCCLRAALEDVYLSGTETARQLAGGLRKLQDAIQAWFVAGVVLYDGEAVVGFGNNLYAVPLSL